jgi:hypothetical protein
MKHIEIQERTWVGLLAKMHEDYPLSVFAIRSKMRDVLGFTCRRHIEIDEDGWCNPVIHLDFYDELKKTFFLLKYAEYL